MHNTLGRALTRTLDHIPELTTQAIGNFGWTDTPTPWITDALWYVALGAAAGIGVLSGRVRELLALLLAFAAYLALPLVLTIATWQSSGYALQGRYILPAAIGIPILALASPRIGRLPERALRRVTLLIGLAVGVAQVSAFHYALRRYHVGDAGPIFGTAGVAHRLVWNPPLGATALDLADLVCWVGLVALLIWAPRRRAVAAPDPTAVERAA